MKMKKDREVIIKSVSKYDGFKNEIDKLIFIQSINFFFDKFEFEKFYNKRNFTYKEYKKYFKSIIKDFSPQIHKENKKEIKKMEKRK